MKERKMMTGRNGEGRILLREMHLDPALLFVEGLRRKERSTRTLLCFSFSFPFLPLAPSLFVSPLDLLSSRAFYVNPTLGHSSTNSLFFASFMIVEPFP
jgi:hypothetical protein